MRKEGQAKRQNQLYGHEIILIVHEDRITHELRKHGYVRDDPARAQHIGVDEVEGDHKRERLDTLVLRLKEVQSHYRHEEEPEVDVPAIEQKELPALA